MLAKVQQTTIKSIIKAAVAKDTLVHTDEYSVYARLEAWGYQHKTVCHGRGEYARDEDGDGFCEVHVNTIEGFWSLLRSVAASAPGHLAGQAAGLPWFLPVRAQRSPTREGSARCPRLSPGCDPGLTLRSPLRATGKCSTCLVPGFDGALFSSEWKDALWAKFCMG